MDHCADDLADLVQHLDLHDAGHIGHSAGGGEVARPRPSRRVPQAAFEGFQTALAANRSEF
jgi:non-heme chloroperoxidase